MTNMAPTQVQNMLDHAAVQSDRWLMIALLVILLIGGAWLIRVVLGAMMKQMNGIVDEFKEGRDEMAKVISKNTEAFVAYTEVARAQNTAFHDLTKEVATCRYGSTRRQE